jgi:hypothetical protein
MVSTLKIMAQEAAKSAKENPDPFQAPPQQAAPAAWHTQTTAKGKGKHRSLAEVILCKLCRQCWDNDLPSKKGRK